MASVYTDLTVDEAKAIVRAIGIKFANRKQYKAWCAEHKGTLPYNPDVIFADKGWPGWREFLGTAKK